MGKVIQLFVFPKDYGIGELSAIVLFQNGFSHVLVPK